MKYCTIKSRDDFVQQYKDLISDEGGRDQFVKMKKAAKELIRTVSSTSAVIWAIVMDDTFFVKSMQSSANGGMRGFKMNGLRS